MPEAVTLFEMGPRDGLQNEAKSIPTADKIKLVDMLADVGFSKIETASFVSPKWVPQMADGADVLAGVTRRVGVRYTALTPNMKGYERAKAANVDEIAIFGSASEGFSKSNLNMSKADALDMFHPVAEAAKADDMPMRGYVSCVAVCPFDGPTAPEDVAEAVEAMLALGCYEVSLGDTIGRGTPEMTEAFLAACLNVTEVSKLAGHFHDTGGMALDNIEVSLEQGLRCFDAAVGGLGGCPFAPGAAGNVATEDVADLMASLGFDPGLDQEKLSRAASFAKTLRTV